MSYANVGMRHPVWAPITAMTDGAECTYGTGRVIQEAIEATLSYTSPSGDGLYGDDRLVDMDTGITGYNVSFNPTGIKGADRVAMLGEVAVTDGEYDITDSEPPWGGFGFFRVMRDEDGKKYYEALWCRKLKFRMPSETARTKEGTIQWRTPQLEGTGAGVYTDSSDVIRYIRVKEFETASAAKTWLDGKANVPGGTTT